MSEVPAQHAASLAQCNQCSAPVFDDAKFCQECGISLQQSAPSGKPIEAIRDFASGALEQAEKLAKDAMASKDVKKIAGGAIIGLGVGAVLPILSAGAGAVLGAAFIGARLLSSDKKED